MINRLTQMDRELVLRSKNGERSVRYSPLMQAGLVTLAIFFFAYTVFLTANFAYSLLSPSNQTDLADNLVSNYEARINELATERDRLNEELVETQTNGNALINNLGRQQDLLFALESEKYELAENLEALRNQLVSNQSRLEALDLQIETQEAQITNLASGNSGDFSTLGKITDTLAETAVARDQARSQVQRLQGQLASIEENIQAEARQREILFEQIEDAIEVSLVPMRQTISATGLNVDSILNSVRKNYSGQGGVDADADLSSLISENVGTDRLRKMLLNLDEVSQLNFAIGTLPIATPITASYRLSSPYGYRRHPITGRTKLHTGVDMAGAWGTPVFATGDGVIEKAGWESGYGKTIRIKHANGLSTVYAHLSKIRVSPGQSVGQGERIADTGSTGMSTGPHLHYEVRLNGDPKNPMNYIKASQYVR